MGEEYGFCLEPRAHLVQSGDQFVVKMCIRDRSKEDLENNLGVIASSGSYRFRQEMAEKDEKTEDVDIIGQFGVGFYSAFMVADTITVTTKKYGEEQAWQ